MASLTRSDDPLVWIDCEMTGLDPAIDTILSISCFITDSQLNFITSNPFEAIIHHSKTRLDQMSEWCVTTHTSTGLVAACVASSTDAETAAMDLRKYILATLPADQPLRTALLAGNSVHADKIFLMREPWLKVLDILHYRILDVSAIKEGVRRWCGDDILARGPVKKNRHTATEDILESIEEARYYRELFNKIRFSDE